MNRPSPSAPMVKKPAEDDAHLRETLKRCPPAILDAALEFRRTGGREPLDTLLRGLVERHMECESRSSLTQADDGLRLAEDLGIDSLTLMEIGILAEDALPVTIRNEDLRLLRTVGDFRQFFASRLLGEPPRRPAGADSRAHVEPEGRERVPAA